MSVEKKTMKLGNLKEALDEFCNRNNYRNTMEKRLFQWHISNLEYANATNIDKLSLQFWNHDDPYSFSGPHCLLRQSFGYLAEKMGMNTISAGGKIKTQYIVEKIEMFDNQKISVKGQVHDSKISNNSFSKFELNANYVVVTLPLGVLKKNSVIFNPELPHTKKEAISRLGFGVLDKVVLVFESCFWDLNTPMIGFASEEPGCHFMFVNMFPVVGAYVLISLVSGRFCEENGTKGWMKMSYWNVSIPYVKFIKVDQFLIPYAFVLQDGKPIIFLMEVIHI